MTLNIKLFLFVALAVFVGGCAVLWIQLLWCSAENGTRIPLPQAEIGFHAMLAEKTS
jgi:hypothetical protein